MINKLVIIILLLGYFVTGVYAGEVTVSSGTSVDLTAHRRPYATVLKMGQRDFNVIGAAIVNARVKDPDPSHSLREYAYALVFYSMGHGLWVQPTGLTR